MQTSDAKRVLFTDYSRLATFVLGNWIVAGICCFLCLRALSIRGGCTLFSLALFISHYGSVFLTWMLLLVLFRCIGRRTAGFAAVFSGWLLVLTLIIDTGIFLQWRFHLNLPVLSLFFNPAGWELVNFPPAMYVKSAAVIVVVGVAEFVWWRCCRKVRFPRIAFGAAVVWLFVMPFFQAWNAWVFFHHRNAEMICTEAVPFHFGLTAEDFLLAHGFVPEKSAVVRLEKDSGAFCYPRAPLRFAEKKRPNILIVVVDGLRGDLMAPSTMPKMFRRAETGCLFTRHISGGNCTRTGMFTLFYGIPGTYWQIALDRRIGSALMKGALACDYDIGIFSSASLAGPPLDQTVFADVRPLRLHSTGGNVLLRDQNTIRDLEAFLAHHEKNKKASPFFAMLMLDHIHANALPKNYPKYFPTDLDNLDFTELDNSDATLPGRVFNLYRNIGRFCDDTLDEAFDRLEKQGALADTIVVLTGDHGQEANETRTNSWQHNSNYTRYQVHVPMIVWGIPGKKGRFDHVTTHMDVPVTLLGAMGCENPPSDYSTGKDLFDPSERGAIVLSSYLNRAIFYDGKILELTQNGAMLSYDCDGKEIPIDLDSSVFSDALEQVGRFMR